MPRLAPRARRARVQERQAQILAAAARVFARKGFERATIAEIAREAGVAEGSIYNYFKNKGDLLVSLPQQFVQSAVHTLNAEAFASAAPSTPPAAALPAAARAFVSTMRQNAPILRILLSTLPTMKPPLREKYLEQVVLYATGALEAYFREQSAQGVLRRDLNPALLARAFIGLFFPLILIQEVLQVPDPARVDDETLIAANVSLFLQGALPPPPRRSAK